MLNNDLQKMINVIERLCLGRTFTVTATLVVLAHRHVENHQPVTEKWLRDTLGAMTAGVPAKT